MRYVLAATLMALPVTFAMPPAPAQAAPADAAVAIPDTPAGRGFAAWYEAYNSGDLETVRAYNERYGRTTPPEAWVESFEGTGPMRLVRFATNEPNRVVALLTVPESDDLYRSSFATDPENEFVFTDAILSIIDRPPDLALPRMTQAEALASLDARAKELAAERGYSGAVLIEADGEIVYDQRRGAANRQTGEPITPDTRFRLGSMNKMFTGVAILQLVSQGRMSLDGTVGDYGPDYPNADIRDHVTVRQMLSHSGGTGEIFTDEYFAQRNEIRTHADYVALFGERGPEFEPGSQDGYSNYGFILLGYLIERVTGQSYYGYVREHIFAPAGMTQTGSLPEETQVEGRSIGYTGPPGEQVPNTDTLPWRGTAAGGGYSTIPDLLRFSHALTDGTLLPAEWLDRASTPQNDGGWYGLGLALEGQGRTRYFGHGGGAPGMNSDLRIYPELGVTIISLANVDPSHARTLAGHYGLRMPVPDVPEE